MDERIAFMALGFVIMALGLLAVCIRQISFEKEMLDKIYPPENKEIGAYEDGSSEL